MAAEIPTQEPSSFIAGDTVQWTKSLSDYPASTWTLTYEFRGNVRKTVVCTADGDDFLATITAAISATYPPGEYAFFGRVSSGAEVHTIPEACGTMVVSGNPSVGTSAQDRRTHARKMLDAIEAMLEGVASRFEQSYTIDIPGGSNRMLSTVSRDELIRFRSHYAQLVAQEKNAERIAQGQPSRNRILTVFTR